MIVGLAIALTLGGSALAESSWNGRPLVEWAARDSACPLNVVWPGYERPLHQSRIDSFVTFDVERPGGPDVTIRDVSNFNILYNRLIFRDFRVLGECSSPHGRFGLTAGKEEIRDLVLENLPEGVYYSKKATFTNPKGLK